MHCGPYAGKAQQKQLLDLLALGLHDFHAASLIENRQTLETDAKILRWNEGDADYKLCEHLDGLVSLAELCLRLPEFFEAPF